MKIVPTILIDSREQAPWTFHNLPSQRGTLTTADYSILHLEHLVGIERKTLPDFVACCGHGRDRFVKERLRLQGLRFRAVFLECTLADIEAGDWRSKLTPNHVFGSLAAWQAQYQLSVWLGGTHQACGQFIERYLYQCARTIATEAGAVGDLISVGSAV